MAQLIVLGDGGGTAVRTASWPHSGDAFVASRGCSRCEYRGTCHDKRQRIQDALRDAGKQRGCVFWIDIREAERSARRWRRVRALAARIRAALARWGWL
jgi:hypothetical protein